METPNIFSFHKRPCQILVCQLCDCPPALYENNLRFKAISVWAFVVGSALIKTKTFKANLLQKISHRTVAKIRKTEHVRETHQTMTFNCTIKTVKQLKRTLFIHLKKQNTHS